jgi:hypothetical protein
VSVIAAGELLAAPIEKLLLPRLIVRFFWTVVIRTIPVTANWLRFASMNLTTPVGAAVSAFETNATARVAGGGGGGGGSEVGGSEVGGSEVGGSEVGGSALGGSGSGAGGAGFSVTVVAASGESGAASALPTLS